MENTLNDDIKCPHCGETIKADIEQKKYKQLYDRYNQCRDAELDRFWKNSVFVWVFLAFCFAAFGTLMKDFNMPNVNLKPMSPCDYYLFLSVISVVGLIISWIWVWMARGLKAWYEVYESAIWELESCRNVFGYPHQYTIENFWTLKESNQRYKKILTDSKSLSPSKIVILIGCLLIVLWLGSFLYSVKNCLASGTICCFWPCCSGCRFLSNWLFLGIVVLCVAGLICGMRQLIISSTLRDKGHNDVLKNIRHELMDNPKVSNLYLEVKNEDVSFFLHPKNVNEEYKILQAMFSNIKFRYEELYIVKCSYSEMLKRYQIIDNFRKLLITDFALYHKKITIDNDQLILSPLDSIKMRDVKNILDKHIKECKYLNEKYDDLSYIVEHKILRNDTQIQIPMDLLKSLNINFRIKFKYYQRVLTKKIFHFCGKNK